MLALQVLLVCVALIGAQDDEEDSYEPAKLGTNAPAWFLAD